MFILAPFSQSLFFWICSSRQFTSRNIQSAWWSWSGPAGMWPQASTARSGRVVSVMTTSVEENNSVGAFWKATLCISVPQVHSEGGDRMSRLRAAESLLPALQHLPPPASAPPAALQAHPGEALQALPTHPRRLQGLQRYSAAFFLYFHPQPLLPCMYFYLQSSFHLPFSGPGGHFRDGGAAPRHHDEDGELPEASRAEERSDRHRHPRHPREGIPNVLQFVHLSLSAFCPPLGHMFVFKLQEFIRLGCLSKLSGKGLQQRMFFLVRQFSCFSQTKLISVMAQK